MFSIETTGYVGSREIIVFRLLVETSSSDLSVGVTPTVSTTHPLPKSTKSFHMTTLLKKRRERILSGSDVHVKFPLYITFVRLDSKNHRLFDL